MTARRHAFRGDDTRSYLASRGRVLVNLGPLMLIGAGIWVLLIMGAARVIGAIAEALR